MSRVSGLLDAKAELRIASERRSLANVNLLTALHLATPQSIRGRVLGLLMTVAMSLAPISMGLSGIVADLMGRAVPRLFIACGWRWAEKGG